MQNLNNILQRKNLILFFISTLFVGICTNRVLMSTSMMALFFTVLIGGIYHRDLLTDLRRLSKGGVFFSIMLLIIITVIGGIYSSNTEYYVKMVVLGSPFLFIPLAIGAAPVIRKKDLILLIYIFCIILFFTGIVILANYLMHYKEMTDALSRGKAIETPFKEHIRYSIMMAFCIVSLIYLRIKNWYLMAERTEKYGQIVLLSLFVILIHILSVRSGLLSLYLCLVIFAFYFSYYKRKYLIGACILLGVVLLPVAAYQFISGVTKKIDYMIYDMNMLSQGKGGTYSDSERLISMAAGAKVIKENVIWGVGTGDIKDEMNRIYARDYSYIDPANRKLPHNQFLWVWASNGLIGVVCLLIGIFYPLLYKKNYKDLLLVMFFIITVSSFITEHTLEIQVGIAFYVIWLTILLNYLNGTREDEYSL